MKKVAAVIVPVSESTSDTLYKLAKFFRVSPGKIVHSALIDFISENRHRVEPAQPLPEWAQR